MLSGKKQVWYFLIGVPWAFISNSGVLYTDTHEHEHEHLQTHMCMHNTHGYTKARHINFILKWTRELVYTNVQARTSSSHIGV